MKSGNLMEKKKLLSTTCFCLLYVLFFLGAGADANRLSENVCVFDFFFCISFIRIAISCGISLSKKQLHIVIIFFTLCLGIGARKKLYAILSILMR